MSFANEKTTATKFFLQGWNADATPVQLPNTDFLVKNNGVRASSSGITQWCRFEVNPSSSNQVDLSPNKRVRTQGSIVVTIFVKAGTGESNVLSLADDVVNILQFKEVDSEYRFYTRAANVIELGQDANNSFFQVSVIIPYYRDSFHP